MTPPLHWSHRAAEAEEDGIATTRSATEAERAALARALDIVAVDRLTASYDIVGLAQGRFRLRGSIEAHVVQACVVSLEPVGADIADTFSVEFRPKGETGADAGEQSVLEGDDIEPLEGGVIDAGRIVFEVLSGALDPYPRKPGAELNWREETAAGTAEGPFAALAKLKPPL
jgi:uncharacterized metal-binding protein YceD (DUF177 family)